MSEPPLLRCVCGLDIPVEGGTVIECPGCGREFPTQAQRAAETLALPAIRGKEGHDCADPGPEPQPRRFDHFEILEEIGRGGMGKVYRALDRSLERYVAIKVISREDVLDRKEQVEAFVHEARAQARVNHPGVATIYHVGFVGKQPYFAMELVPGVDLESRLEDGPLPFAEVIDIGIGVVRALWEAHEKGVVHRDIKPGNILVSPEGRVKVTDFGLSKTEKGGLRVTGSRAPIGSPYYMSPEQARGRPTDFRTDIYSLGATLYHLAYGRPVFEGAHHVAVITRHVTDPPTFPEPAPEGIPERFPEVLSRMLAKEPTDRHRSYADVERELSGLRIEPQRHATFWSRAGATAVDGVGFVILWAMAVALAFVVVVRTDQTASPADGGEAAIPAATSGEEAERGVDDRFAQVPGRLGLGLGLALLLLQIVFRRTPGKMLARLRIVRTRGRAIEWWRAGLRLPMQLLPIVYALVVAAGHASEGVAGVLCLGDWLVDHLWSLFRRDRRSLHDLLLGTEVVEAGSR